MLEQELVVIYDVSVQDRAALSVSNYLGITEAEPCGTHNGNKIERSAIGELTWSKKKIVVHPFVKRKALIKRFQDLAKHFSSTKINRLNYTMVLNQHPELPRVTIERDLNKILIEARHTLIKSILRAMNGLKYYQIQYQPIGFPSDTEWEAARQVEGVLNTVHCIL